jgi:hypothetical protein
MRINSICLKANAANNQSSRESLGIKTPGGSNRVNLSSSSAAAVDVIDGHGFVLISDTHTPVARLCAVKKKDF